LDAVDRQIMELMAAGLSNTEIAKKTARPLSTIQRRTKNLIKRGVVRQEYVIDYTKMGYKVGFVHVYVENGDVRETAAKVKDIDNVQSVTIHVGNSDIVARYVCRFNADLLALFKQLKHTEGVNKIVWSEEVLALPPKLPAMA
jgi:DNA-binding Lrp family transcriptional regulator